MAFSLNLSSNKEVTVTPDFKIHQDGELVYDNLEQKEPLKVVFKKINGFLLSDKALESSIDDDGKLSNRLNKMKYLNQVFVRFENPFLVNLDGSGERELTLEDVINYSEFTDLLAVLFIEASKVINGTKGKESKSEKVKKS